MTTFCISMFSLDCSRDAPTVSGVPWAQQSGKDKVVVTIEVLAHFTGLAAVDEQGRRASGGHSLRVSGARWLGSMGVPILQIASLARWSTAVVERYVGDAVLITLCSRVRRARGRDHWRGPGSTAHGP